MGTFRDSSAYISSVCREALRPLRIPPSQWGSLISCTPCSPKKRKKKKEERTKERTKENYTLTGGPVRGPLHRAAQSESHAKKWRNLQLSGERAKKRKKEEEKYLGSLYLYPSLLLCGSCSSPAVPPPPPPPPPIAKPRRHAAVRSLYATTVTATTRQTHTPSVRSLYTTTVTATSHPPSILLRISQCALTSHHICQQTNEITNRHSEKRARNPCLRNPRQILSITYSTRYLRRATSPSPSSLNPQLHIHTNNQEI